MYNQNEQFSSLNKYICQTELCIMNDMNKKAILNTIYNKKNTQYK